VSPSAEAAQGISLFSVEASYEITPEPSDEQRAAILAALAAEQDERRTGSSWSDALLPARSADDDEP